MPRFTLTPSAELLSELESHFSRMRESAANSALGLDEGACLVLGGGYGRGEGAIVRNPEGDRLHNDLDYFLFVPYRLKRAAENWRVLAEREESSRLEVDVEIKVMTKSDLDSPTQSMMVHDLVSGHHVVFGDGRFLSDLKSLLDSSELPLCEATRLLWNRGSGLFFARCRIEETEQREFVTRNHAKAKLALGDALLCMRGEYHSSFLQRAERIRHLLSQEQISKEVAACYEEAVEFRMDPAKSDKDWGMLELENRNLSSMWMKIFLEIESVRLGTRFNSAEEYGLFKGRLCPEIPIWKGTVCALRDLLRHRKFLSPVWDYPRSNLMRALSLLIDQKTEKLGEKLRKLIPTSGQTEVASEWESAYSGWWLRYS